MKKSAWLKLGIFAGLCLWTGIILVASQNKLRATRTASARSAEPPSSERIIRFVRDKFGVSEKVGVVLDPFHNSPNPEFLETIVTADDGQNTKTSKKSTDICVSKDGRYLVVSYVPAIPAGPSAFLPVGNDSREQLASRIHDIFRLPENVKVNIGAYKSSPFPSFLETTLTVDDGKTKNTPDAYLTRDHHYFILGSIYDLGVDPVREARHTLVLQNQPSAGPQDAPVTIVEFADLECPTCARAHDFLEKNLLPTYQGKVRLVFKEFPLPMHEWASTAAIANQCAYRINPAVYLPYRTLIFQHQVDIDTVKGNASEVRDRLIDYGEQAGLDKLQLAGCVDSKASLPRVAENLKEGKLLSVSSTPTFFINGRIVLGAQPEALYQAVDDAIAESKKKK